MNSLNSFRHSILYYSDDKKSSDNNNDAADATKADNKTEKKQKRDKKAAKQEQSASKSFSPETQSRLNELLKKLSSRSTLGIVKEVQTSKPIGYKNVRNVQRLDAKETKPKNVRDAARAVSQEFGDANVEKDILSPYKTDKKETDFLEYVERKNEFFHVNIWLINQNISIVILFTVTWFPQWKRQQTVKEAAKSKENHKPCRKYAECNALLWMHHMSPL